MQTCQLFCSSIFVCSCLYDTKLNDIIIFMEIVHNNCHKIHLSMTLFVMMIPHGVGQLKPSGGEWIRSYKNILMNE